MCGQQAGFKNQMRSNQLSCWEESKEQQMQFKTIPAGGGLPLLRTRYESKLLWVILLPVGMTRT